MIAPMKRLFSLLAVFHFAVVMPLQAAEKRLPLKGEVFIIQEHTAFLILPKQPKSRKTDPVGLVRANPAWVAVKFREMDVRAVS